MVYSDQPPAGANAKEKKLKDEGVYWSNKSEVYYPSDKDSKEVSTTRVAEEKLARDYSRVAVVMYMTDWWGYCKQARQYSVRWGAGLIEHISIRTRVEKTK